MTRRHVYIVMSYSIIVFSVLLTHILSLQLKLAN